jgi:hypothetical protein
MIGNIPEHIEREREDSGCLPICRRMQYTSKKGVNENFKIVKTYYLHILLI